MRGALRFEQVIPARVEVHEPKGGKDGEKHERTASVHDEVTQEEGGEH